MLGCVVYTVSQAGAAKADKRTNEAVQTISTKLELYILNNGVPGSLKEAGINNMPSTVKYTKISDEKYKICFDYKNASSGFDAGWWSLLGGSFAGADSKQVNTDHTYFDAMVQYQHKKGMNCQTVTNSYAGFTNSNYNSGNSSSSFGSGSGSSSQSYDSLACSSDYDSYYGMQGQATVKSIDTATKTISFETSGQTIKDAQGNAQPAMASAKYSEITIFCTSAKHTTTASSVKAGEKIKFFANSTSSASLDKIQL